jgi:hypothetical protein
MRQCVHAWFGITSVGLQYDRVLVRIRHWTLLQYANELLSLLAVYQR